MTSILIDKTFMIQLSTIVSFMKVFITFFLLYVTKNFDLILGNLLSKK